MTNEQLAAHLSSIAFSLGIANREAVSVLTTAGVDGQVINNTMAQYDELKSWLFLTINLLND